MLPISALQHIRKDDILTHAEHLVYHVLLHNGLNDHVKLNLHTSNLCKVLYTRYAPVVAVVSLWLCDWRIAWDHTNSLEVSIL